MIKQLMKMLFCMYVNCNYNLMIMCGVFSERIWNEVGLLPWIDIAKLWTQCFDQRQPLQIASNYDSYGDLTHVCVDCDYMWSHIIHKHFNLLAYSITLMTSIVLYTGSS